jgi:hypothetical protein
MSENTSPEAVRARIADFCSWFGLEPVQIKVRKGQVYLTDDLMTWIKTAGASIDWIICGRARCMAATYREKYAITPDQQEILDAMAMMSEPAQEAFVGGLKGFAEGKITMQELEDRVMAAREVTPA